MSGIETGATAIHVLQRPTKLTSAISPPKWIKPQLTRLGDEALSGGEWIHEISGGRWLAAYISSRPFLCGLKTIPLGTRHGDAPSKTAFRR